MELLKLSLADWLTATGDKEPIPSAGSSVTLSAATGVGLLRRVVVATSQKKSHAQYHDALKALVPTLDKLQQTLKENIEKDADAFLAVRETFFMPEITMDDRLEKVEVLDLAFKATAMIPLEVMDLCVEALTLVEAHLAQLNKDLLVDVYSAVMQIFAGLSGSYASVRKNLQPVDDPAHVTQQQTKAADLLKKGRDMVNHIEMVCVKELEV